MRILVLWADPTSANLGVQALAFGAEQVCRQAFGDDTLVDFHDFSGGALGLPITGRPLLTDLVRGRRDGLVPALREYDAVLNVGEGDSFSDIYGPRRAALMALTHQRVHRSRTTHLIGPQTIGPFKRAVWRRLAIRTMSRASLVTGRDTASVEYAKRLGIRNVTLATDLVFALPVPNVPIKSKRVLVNASGLLASGSSHVNGEMYRGLMNELITKLQDLGTPVALLAHVLDNPSDDNDVRFGVELAGRTGCDLIVPTSLDDARLEIARSAGLVGSRMHACLNALSVGVPALPLAYSRKFAPLMNDLGWPHTVDLRDGGVTGAELAVGARTIFADAAHRKVAETARGRLTAYANDLASAIK